VRRLQRAELLDHQESEDDDGAAGVEEILSALPETYAAQRSEIIDGLLNLRIDEFSNPTILKSFNSSMNSGA
jgi:hypothetical protein